MASVMINHSVRHTLAHPVSLHAQTTVADLLRISEWLTATLTMDQYVVTTDGTYTVWFEQAAHAAEFSLTWL